MTVLERTGAATLLQEATITHERILRMSVEQYQAMVQANILTEDDPVELLEGWLVQKSARHPRHQVVTGLIYRALERFVGGGWYVDSQEPITTADSEPEPDVIVIRGELVNFLQRHPQPHEIALVVEVAEATVRRDRGAKKRIYARAGIPVYWLVNLVNQTVSVYAEPDSAASPPDYRRHKLYCPGEEIPVVVDGTVIGQLAVNEILPVIAK
jgi:Uma2 family endonuclease